MLRPTNRVFAIALPVLVALVAACSDADTDGDGAPSPSSDAGVDSGALADAGGADGAASDVHVATNDAADAHDAHDAANPNACAAFGAPGECMTVAACNAIPDHSPFAGQCTGPATIECCIDTPDVADNPPIPTGYKLMTQSQVTPAMTTWAVTILHDPVTYPMYSTTTMTFGTLLVLARVEWHPPDFQNSVVHRGVTLYVPV